MISTYNYVAKIGENSLDFYSDERWQQVKDAAQEHSFFHWDLEFPDIFYDEDGNRRKNPGFDGVVGNPPYVRHELFRKLNSKFTTYEKISSKMDLSGYFHFRAIQYLKNHGFLGVISSDTWMTTIYGKAIQELFLENEIHIIIKPNFKVFEHAETTPAILIIKKINKPSNKNMVKLMSINNKSDILSDTNTIIRSQAEFQVGRWNVYFNHKKILPKIEMIKLEDVGNIRFGTKTGYKPFFVLTKDIVQKYHIDECYIRPMIPDNLSNGLLENGNETEYILDVNESKEELTKSNIGKNILNYIKNGETIKIIPKRGSNKKLIPLYEIPSIKSRKIWYSLGLNDIPPIFLSRLVNNYIKVYENASNFHAINTFVFFTPNNKKYTHTFLAYFVSSIFALQLENSGNPMGGGALSIEVINFNNMLVPNFDKMPKTNIMIMNGAWENYKKNPNREILDSKVLDVLGFNKSDIRDIKNELTLLRNRRLKNLKKTK